METVPIQTLAPDALLPANGSIRGIVTLSWPYSSSTKQCALLLADPDFRLRSRKGQVRIRFRGPSAEAVARSRVGIGDEVVLSLGGASWAQDAGPTPTPGRSVEGELVYSRRLELQVQRTDGEVTLCIDEPTPVQSPQRPQDTITATPAPNIISEPRLSLDGAIERMPIYSSPAFAKRLRLSGESFLDLAYDPFADGDLNDETANKRSRVSFGNVGQWRYADRVTSPVRDDAEMQAEGAHQTSGAEDAFMQDDVQGTTLQQPAEGHVSITDREAVSRERFDRSVMPESMPPPPLPRLQTSDAQIHRSDQETMAQDTGEGSGPATPTLEPVLSSTLPLPSPFPTESTLHQHASLDAALAARSQISSQTDAVSSSSAGAVADVISEEARIGGVRIPSAHVTATANLKNDALDPTRDTEEGGRQDIDHDALSGGSRRNTNDETNMDTSDVRDQQQTVVELLSDTEQNTEPDDGIDKYDLAEGDIVEVEDDIVETMDADEAMPDDHEDVLNESDVEEVIDPSELGSPPSDDDDDDDVEEHEIEEEIEAIRPVQTAEMPSAPSPITQTQRQAETAEPHDGFLSQPQTPTKFPRGDFGLDGASATVAPQLQSTPHSERDRIMAQTFKSLFGFSDLPEPSPQKQEVATPTPAVKSSLSEMAFGRLAAAGLETATVEAKEPVSSKVRIVADPLSDEVAKVPASGSEPGPQPTVTDSARVREADVGLAEPTHADRLTSVELVIDHDTHENEEEVGMPDSEISPEIEVEHANLTGSRPSPATLRSNENQATIELPSSPLPDANTSATHSHTTHDAEQRHGLGFEDLTGQREPALEDYPAETPEVEVIDLDSSSDHEAGDAIGLHAVPSSADSVPHDPDEAVEVDEPADASIEPASLDDVVMHEELAGEDSMIVEPAAVMQAPVAETEVLGAWDQGPAAAKATTELIDEDSPDESRTDELSRQPLAIEVETVHYPSNTDAPKSPEHLEAITTSDETAPPNHSVATEEPQDLAPPTTETTVIEFSSSPPITAASPQAQNTLESGLLDDFVHTDKVQSLNVMHDSEMTTGEANPAVEVNEADPSLHATILADVPKVQYQVLELPVAVDEGSSYPALPLSQPDDQQTLDAVNELSIQQPQSETLVDALPPTSQPTQSEPQLQQSQDDTQDLVAGVILESAQPSQSTSMEDVLPPTPQLTQPEAEIQQPQEGLQEQESIVAEGTQELPEVAAHPVDLLETGIEHHQLQDGERERTDVIVIDDGVTENLPLDDVIGEDAEPRVPVVSEPPAPIARSTPARKSLRSRLSNVPDVISAWFSPKRSSVVSEAQGQDRELAAEGAGSSTSAKRQKLSTLSDSDAITNGLADATHGLGALSERTANGVLTQMGYFTPLTRIEEKLNPSSQQAYGISTVDVLAVVTDKTKEPERAKGGPRDFFTIFKVTDASMTGNTSYRVEVFRPWKATLPVAEAGDVVLLRSFAVKSRKRQPYLLSTDASAWCVWRYADAHTAGENQDKPAWARKPTNGSDAGTREEIKGPPVELGEEERQLARNLRLQWMDRHMADGAAETELTEPRTGFAAKL